MGANITFKTFVATILFTLEWPQKCKCDAFVPPVSSWNVCSPLDISSHFAKVSNQHSFVLGMAIGNSWSCTAFVQRNVLHKTSIILETHDREQTMVKFNDQMYDISSPREWIEYTEATEGLPGVYTVMRCDLMISSHRGNNDDSELKNKVYVWGKEFHLERLQASYCLMMGQDTVQENQLLGNDKDAGHNVLEAAVDDSKAVIDSLLKTTVGALWVPGYRSLLDDNQGAKIVVLTLLWTPISNQGGGPSSRQSDWQVLVQGHIFSSNEILSVRCGNPVPVVASIGLDEGYQTNNDGDFFSIPSRYNHMPMAKISSWCRERRPIEEAFKLPGIGEVLLVRPLSSKSSWKRDEYFKNWEILEGLTSNIFIVYQDGTLRTTQIGVLHGYAQRLVIESAARRGIVLDPRPITLQDARDGLWTEAFLTSSIRIIVPVSKIVLLRNHDKKDWNCDRFSMSRDSVLSESAIWAEKSLDDLSSPTKRWKVFYDDILQYSRAFR